MSDASRKLQELLRQLFQFDVADVDFGIYRILNLKRAAVSEFIDHDLLQAVDDALGQGALASQAQAAAALEKARDAVLNTLGSGALDADGALAPAFHGTPIGKAYLEAQQWAAGAANRDALEAAIFNHLVAFFSRYYDDGDFISKRRYSRREKYAIPYNGEEVTLHWANSDQYYVKTGETFTDYRYKAPNGVAVHFKLRAADVEKDNVKGDKRFFFPLPADVTFDTPAREVLIPFEYRPPTAQETTRYGERATQDGILAEALKTVPDALKGHPDAQAALLTRHHADSNGAEVTYLAHHLRRYTQKNTSDFFVHKDLRGFLTRELDFYLKNEVLNLDDLAAGGEGRAEGWFQMLRVIRDVGARLIAFLAQIEDFQKALFEKKKFIVATRYCISLGRIDPAFYPDIAANDAQREEWLRLFAIDRLPPTDHRPPTTDDAATASSPPLPLGEGWGEGLADDQRPTSNVHADDTKGDSSLRPSSFVVGPPPYTVPLSVDFLAAHPSLVLDTRHFDTAFVDRLLASFDDLDALTDGLLVHSENFQALSLLQARYREQVQCVYIDPPYNTDAGPILYKNGYRSSSWMALLADRLKLGRQPLSSNGILCVTIDDSQQKELSFLLEAEFGKENIAGTVAIRANPSGRPTQTGFALAHEYAVFARSTEQGVIRKLERTEQQMQRYDRADSNGAYEWRNYRREGSNAERERRRRLFYPIYVAPNGMRVPPLAWDDERAEWVAEENPGPDEKVVFPIDDRGFEKTWRGKHENIANAPQEFEARSDRNGNWQVYYKYRPNPEGAVPTTIWIDAKYSATEHGTAWIKRLFGYNAFSYPKSVYAVEDCLAISGMARPDTLCLDYFAGSGTTGHAIINMNREDDGGRKFILVEMGEYFESILLPRIKKVAFAPEWDEGKPTRLATVEEAERGPRVMKVIRLESYEDALNNIQVDPVAGQAALALADYRLRYMLDWETRASATRLDLAALTRPFAYKLLITDNGESRDETVDLAETFAYLLGLRVRTRRALDDAGRRYLVYRGTVDRREVVVLWRDTENWQLEDYQRDRDFVAAQGLTADADEVFVNGDSLIPAARSLDGVFKRRLFGEA